MKEARGGKGSSWKGGRGIPFLLLFLKPHQQHSQLLGVLVALKFPHRGSQPSALSRGSATHQDSGCVQGRRGERPSNHPQPKAAYPNKGRHIPFRLLIKSWLINQTSGSYTSLSFEGKALYSSCKLWSLLQLHN